MHGESLFTSPSAARIACAWRIANHAAMGSNPAESLIFRHKLEIATHRSTALLGGAASLMQRDQVLALL